MFHFFWKEGRFASTLVCNTLDRTRDQRTVSLNFEFICLSSFVPADRPTIFGPLIPRQNTRGNNACRYTGQSTFSKLSHLVIFYGAIEPR